MPIVIIVFGEPVVTYGPMITHSRHFRSVILPIGLSGGGTVPTIDSNLSAEHIPFIEARDE